MSRWLTALLLVTSCLFGSVAVGQAQEPESGYLANRYGFSVLAGGAYDPDHFGLVIVQGVALLDYDKVAWHRAPDTLRLKLELNLGLRTDPDPRLLLSGNALALYYLRQPEKSWRPYLEAGIGVIYTDFQVDGQGLRINFNPQFGAGVEHALTNGDAVTMGVRFSHVSNGNLHHDNRGINAALVSWGYLF